MAKGESDAIGSRFHCLVRRPIRQSKEAQQLVMSALAHRYPERVMPQLLKPLGGVSLFSQLLDTLYTHTPTPSKFDFYAVWVHVIRLLLHLSTKEPCPVPVEIFQRVGNHTNFLWNHGMQLLSDLFLKDLLPPCQKRSNEYRKLLLEVTSFLDLLLRMVPTAAIAKKTERAKERLGKLFYTCDVEHAGRIRVCPQISVLFPPLPKHIELPGNLRKNALGRSLPPRHSNDHQSIRNIDVDPTPDELFDTTEPYLPRDDDPQSHLPVEHRLADRQFRLLREETLRAYRASIQSFFQAADPRKKLPGVVVATGCTVGELSAKCNWGVYCDVDFDWPLINRQGYDALQAHQLVACIYKPRRGQSAMFMAMVVSDVRAVKVFDARGQTVVDDTRRTVSLRVLCLRYYYNLENVYDPAHCYLVEVKNHFYCVPRPILQFLQTFSPRRYVLAPDLHLGFSTPATPYYYNKTIPEYLVQTRLDVSFLTGSYSSLDIHSSSSYASILKKLKERRNKIRLDDSQLAAFVAGITQKVALIQGPPGTGKSFVGVNIARVLIDNKDEDDPPILCICQTNHALDQFLLDIIKSGVKKKHVLRIGSGSSEPILQERTIKTLLNSKKIANTQYRRYCEVGESIDWDQHPSQHELQELESKQDEWRQARADGWVQHTSKVKLVGMTTSGCALNRHYIRTMRPQVIICEEAGEVLESHILSSLHKRTQHLILIGDHLQLRPTLQEHFLKDEARQGYSLDVSLFERLVRHYQSQYSDEQIAASGRMVTLQTQRRMRPEISQLIRPLYPNLQNHPSVCAFPPVQGLQKPLWFFDHSHRETKSSEESASNTFERDVAKALVEYLLQNGYEAKDLSVIVAYRRQFELVSQSLKATSVRVSTVDGFQGEQAKIIILSLVRCNPNGVIGFLKTPNRVNVMLSRAQHGMIILGSATTILKNSPQQSLLRQAVETLKAQKMLGPHIPLECAAHKKVTLVTNVKQLSDRAILGGCGEKCNLPLSCGHQCEKQCHGNDLTHTDYICDKRCSRMAPCGKHLCARPCRIKCGCDVQVHITPTCGHRYLVLCRESHKPHSCTTMIPAVNVLCGHPITVPCYIKTNPASLRRYCIDLQCQHPCEKTGPCGIHRCKRKCFETCFCDAEVTGKRSECGHLYQRRCYQALELCKTVVYTTNASCGHDVSLQCWAHRQPTSSTWKMAMDCREPCQRMAPCGDHFCLQRCNEPCRCVAVITITPPCQHSYPSLCREKDKPYVCTKLVEVKNPACGHTVQMSCDVAQRQDSVEWKALMRCQRPCERLAHCQKHPCTHLCYQDCRCEETVTMQPSCGHPYRILCREKHKHVPCKRLVIIENPYCSHPVELRCEDNQTRNTVDWFEATRCLRRACQQPTKCGHPCTNVCGTCEHSQHPMAKAFAKTFQCPAECDKLLECSHSCSGVCGMCSHNSQHRTARAPPACPKLCNRSCEHSICLFQCSQTCSFCLKDCSWVCGHHEDKSIARQSCGGVCGAPCTRLPCDQRCTKLLLCGHRCPGLCGEECPYSSRACPQCAVPALRQVPICLKDPTLCVGSAHWNPVTQPVLQLPCRHVWTVDTLDEIFRMSLFYSRNEAGTWTGPVSIKFGSVRDIKPQCPTCGVPITNVKRYGRPLGAMRILQAHQRLAAESGRLLVSPLGKYLSSMEFKYKESFTTQPLLFLSRTPVSHPLPTERICLQLYSELRPYLVGSCSKEDRWKKSALHFPQLEAEKRALFEEVIRKALPMCTSAFNRKSSWVMERELLIICLRVYPDAAENHREAIVRLKHKDLKECLPSNGCILS